MFDKDTVIYKYVLSDAPFDAKTISVPKPCVFLDVQMQGGLFIAWFVVPKEPKKYQDVTFVMYGTGIVIEPSDADGLLYIKTIQDGLFVRHLFVSTSFVGQ